jgi:hypothetical protein
VSEASKRSQKLWGAGGEETPRRVYYPDYIAWEQQTGHHDQLSDVFVLGLILGSLAARLHLAEPEELRIFVRSRADLMRANPPLHPVLSQIIEKMTELDRRKRPQDLRQIAKALREQFSCRDPDRRHRPLRRGSRRQIRSATIHPGGVRLERDDRAWQGLAQ